MARTGSAERGLPLWGRVPYSVGSALRNLPVLIGGLALFYSFLVLTHYWLAPSIPEVHIELAASALPKYAAYSVFRIAVAYLLSLLFTVA